MRRRREVLRYPAWIFLLGKPAPWSRDMTPVPSTPHDAEQYAHLQLLGELTSSVTHEFNNLLNNIMLHMAVLEQRGLSDELRAETSQVKQAGRQAATLIKQFQQFCQG